MLTNTAARWRGRQQLRSHQLFPLLLLLSQLLLLADGGASVGGDGLSATAATPETTKALGSSSADIDDCSCQNSASATVKAADEDQRTVVKLGYLTTITGMKTGRQGRTISGALSYAIEQINNCSCLLPDVKLEFLYNDTEGQRESTAALVDMICNNIAAFIGPEGPDCSTEAMVAGSKNRAMFSYKCADAKIASRKLYPTFTRMVPRETRVTSSTLSLLEYHKWKKFSIIFQEDAQWEKVANHLSNQASEKGFSINHYIKFRDPDICCIEDSHQECCTDMWPHPILKRTKESTRIYVFIGRNKFLEQFMKQMKTEQMFEDGKYMVVYLTPETAVPSELASYLWNNNNNLKHQSCLEMGEASLLQWRSLIVVAGSPPRKFDEFADNVRKYNEMAPFNFKTKGSIKKYFPVYVTIYAAHLYDSVMLYAKALHEMIEKRKKQMKSPFNSSFNATVIGELARNGKNAITKSKLDFFQLTMYAF